MTLSRRPHAFRLNMSFALHDIKRVISVYIVGMRQVDLIKDGDFYKHVEYGKRERCSWGKNGKYMRHEIKCIITEIFNGIFRRGK